MVDKVEEVVVQTSDIEFIRDALKNLYYLSVSMDLQQQYRRLDDRGATSALTVQAEDALTKANAALTLSEVENDSDEASEEPEQKLNPIRESE